MKLYAFTLVIFLQSCAFLPTGAIGAKISEGYTFGGKEYNYKITLYSKEASHSHSFIQFLFSSPHEDTEIILTDTIKGEVSANSIVVISGYDKAKAMNLTGGNIEFSESGINVVLYYERTEKPYKINYTYNQKYKILETVE